MTDSQIQSLSNQQKAQIIKNAFSSQDGKNALRILQLHFDTDLPSAPTVGFDTNQTFYRDGNKAPFALIRQIFDGLWSQPDPVPDPETDINLS